jgi:pyruvate dehydrogenase E2 component (dihydrolipoamide acetyltransferase)
MAQEVILPRQGQSVETCHILSWKKAVGDPVQEGDVLVEVETDKAAFDVESTATGTLLHVFHSEGEDVPVLALLALVGEKGEDVSAQIAAAGTEPPAGTVSAAAAARDAAEAAPAAGGEAEGAGAPGAVPTEAPAAPATPGPSQRPAAVPLAPSGRVAISPRARRLAERSGVSPEQVAGALPGGKGSGPRGRILEKDVQAVVGRGGAVPAARAGAPAAPAAARTSLAAAAAPAGAAGAFPGPTQEIPASGIRKVIAQRMHESLQTTAQYSLHAAARAEGLLEFRRKLKESPEEWGLQQVTINDLMNYALTRLLARHPEVNAHFRGDRAVRFERVHLAVAVDTPRGLMVPVVRNADLLSLRQLAAEAARLRAACLDNKVTPDELAGGTFTVTNLGSLGVEQFTPVLNPPQVAILGVGSIQLRPVEDEDGGVEFRRFIGLSLTANHQILDGAPAARFLNELCGAVAEFELLLAG